MRLYWVGPGDEATLGGAWDEATLGGAWERGHTGWGLGMRPHWVVFKATYEDEG